VEDQGKKSHGDKSEGAEYKTKEAEYERVKVLDRRNTSRNLYRERKGSGVRDEVSGGEGVP